MKTDLIHTFAQANKARWDASAHLHGQGKEWDDLLFAASQPGFSVLDESLTATLTALGIAGRSAVQVGCNNARVSRCRWPRWVPSPRWAWINQPRF